MSETRLRSESKMRAKVFFNIPRAKCLICSSPSVVSLSLCQTLVLISLNDKQILMLIASLAESNPTQKSEMPPERMS